MWIIAGAIVLGAMIVAYEVKRAGTKLASLARYALRLTTEPHNQQAKDAYFQKVDDIANDL